MKDTINLFESKNTAMLDEQQQIYANLKNIYIIYQYFVLPCRTSSGLLCCGYNVTIVVPALKLIHELSLQASSDPMRDIGIVSFSFSIY